MTNQSDPLPTVGPKQLEAEYVKRIETEAIALSNKILGEVSGIDVAVIIQAATNIINYAVKQYPPVLQAATGEMIKRFGDFVIKEADVQNQPLDTVENRTAH